MCRLLALVAALAGLVFPDALAAQGIDLRGRGAPEAVPPGELEVDVELLLLVDVSRSMAPEELAIQRQGYIAALSSPRVARAITDGLTGRVALAYVEWAGAGQVRQVTGWRLLQDGDDAIAFARELASWTTFTMSRTSISSALRIGTRMFEDNGYDGLRRVIDVSGDGPNNQGGAVTEARDAALAAGIVINGLPLMTSGGFGADWTLPDLDAYYAACVVGGPGSFVLPVLSWADFAGSVERKLVLELVGTPPPAATGAPVPVQFEVEGYDCLVGERIWQRRRGFYGMP